MIEAYKKKYQTCLEMLEQLRLDRPELNDEVLSYNGILDPMAEGIVPVLVGSEENKNRDHFTGSEKVYRVKVLVGIATDSADLLGVVKSSEKSFITNEKIVNAFVTSKGTFDQTVPMHSNRKVDGKRLWWWVLNGVEIPKEKRPVNSVELKDISYIESYDLSKDELLNEIMLMGKGIGERFRLSTVLESWQLFFDKNKQQLFSILEFELHVTSGFYVRTFVEDLSVQLGIPLMVYSLKRTKIIYSPGK